MIRILALSRKICVSNICVRKRNLSYVGKQPGSSSNFKDCIIFEDNHLLVVCKPPGMLAQGDISESENMLDNLKHYLVISRNKPGAAYLGLVHRIDRPCSGVLVFAKTSKAAARLGESFRSRTVEKDYVCVVNGNLQGEAELNHALRKSGDSRVVVLEDLSGRGENAKPQRKDAVQAKLKYSVLNELTLAGAKSVSKQGAKHQTLLSIKLETGRKHQIRSQLQHIGHPIVGDTKYGAVQSFPDRSIALHAVSLVFEHPITRVRMRFSAPPPLTWEKRFGKSIVNSVDDLIKALF